ncbi:Uncharacterized protein TPAR_03196 [Tolypocladium paradoxum]|uniref:Uncharacterized protein n=1 Tax=Tolypocladium paradoxum TaxID=94208 RepID=A0A2S4L2F6_9HYPO|nr:Uncharacterized protein TPAR_03196 [Tolypocladium paradoxum]
MALPSTPFLADEDRSDTGMDMSDLTTTKQRHKKRLWWLLCTMIQAAIIIFAFWGAASIYFETSQLPATQSALSCEGQPARPDPYRPETLEPGLNTCDCGRTIKEALMRSCVYDTLATAWLPPYCRDDELTAEFDRSGPGRNGEWHYFADEGATIRLNKAEIGMLGETSGKFWASRDWHIAHCLFYWQKYTRMRYTGVIMEERKDEFEVDRNAKDEEITERRVLCKEDEESSKRTPRDSY